MAYEYNPLIPLNLQKIQDAATPGDIDRLQGEIDQIDEDLRNKVPKIRASITELEDGEIGQYQGTTNETFTFGFFYTKGEGEMVVQYQPVSEKTFVYAIGNTTSEVDDAYYQTSDNLDLISTPIFQITSTNTVSIFLFQAGDISISVFMMPFEVNAINGISVNEDYDIFSSYDSGTQTYYYNKGNLAPFVYDTKRNVYEIKFENGNIFALINGDWIQASRRGITAYAPPRFGWSFYRTNYSYGKCVDVFIVSTTYHDVVFPYNEDNIIDLQSIEFAYHAVYQNLLRQWRAISDTTKQLYSYSRVFSPSVQRVNTQPSLNPAYFATAAQGRKADTALQGVNNGTDGDYVTTTVTPKNANNEQSVSVKLTVQPLATADNDHKGLAESSDVKSYIASTTATKAQGTKADTALQGVAKGTDGNYVTTTVTPKNANNEQSVSVELTVQPLATADNDHKGLAESSDVIAYINNLQSQITNLKSENKILKSFHSAQITDVAAFRSVVPNSATSIIFDFKSNQDTTGYTLAGYIDANNEIEVWNNSTDCLVLSDKFISAPTSCSQMFAENYENLTSLDFFNFDTSNVTSFADMFLFCVSLTSLDVSNFDTSNATNFSMMFSECYNLTSLDVSNFDTSNATNFSYMFDNCENLTSLNLSNFDTTNVTCMSDMFYRCAALTSLDLTNFNTTNVAQMDSMFDGCAALTSLDLSNFNTTNVTNMSGMFYGCSGLTTIIAIDWNAPVSSASMFEGCTSLVGGNGTIDNSSHVNAAYAHIDVAGNPGYFTAPSQS